MTTRSLAPRSLAELPERALVTAADVAKFVGCSARSILRTDIPRIEVRPRVVRFFVRDVLAWLERQRANGGAA